MCRLQISEIIYSDYFIFTQIVPLNRLELILPYRHMAFQCIRLHNADAESVWPFQLWRPAVRVLHWHRQRLSSLPRLSAGHRAHGRPAVVSAQVRRSPEVRSPGHQAMELYALRSEGHWCPHHQRSDQNVAEVRGEVRLERRSGHREVSQSRCLIRKGSGQWEVRFRGKVRSEGVWSDGRSSQKAMSEGSLGQVRSDRMESGQRKFRSEGSSGQMGGQVRGGSGQWKVGSQGRSWVRLDRV